MRANYSAQLIDDAYKGPVISIVDQCEGEVAVMSDLPDITSFVVGVHGNYPIVLCDRDSEWHQIVHSDGMFTHVRRIGALQRDEAISSMLV